MSRTPAGSCARNQGTRAPGVGRDPGENCGLSRPARLARSCTASRGYARGSSMRGYARGKIIDAWHDPDAGAAHPAPHHGPGSRGPERSRARSRVTHARRVVRAEIESRGPESRTPAGSRARRWRRARPQGRARGRLGYARVGLRRARGTRQWREFQVRDGCLRSLEAAVSPRWACVPVGARTVESA